MTTIMQSTLNVITVAGLHGDAKTINILSMRSLMSSAKASRQLGRNPDCYRESPQAVVFFVELSYALVRFTNFNFQNQLLSVRFELILRK